ncbi:MAG: hypothetical protein EPN45_19530 [Rhizobiaceae bacterium]|nr:MAG: hypothetical protein EPN45_19530 [Rhizobiaceae bacterium]
MIERHAGRMQIVCECGAAQRSTYARDEFDVMVADARAEGFVIEKIAGEWAHTCPDCAEQAKRSKKGSLL